MSDGIGPGFAEVERDFGVVAVIGMAVRVPGAADIEAFWESLVLGEELVAAPTGLIADFDAGFFGLDSPGAAAMDPQTRLFLEIAHATLEDAGYDPARMNRDVGVVAAAGPSPSADYLATTVSYRLDLRGPSMTLLAVGSGSLAALHLGCGMLRSGECEAVIVGGSNVESDSKAGGPRYGSGAAAVLLKPLDEALRDGDRVEAVVRGSAMNNDGADKPSLSAPSRVGQMSVIMEAMSLADVSPSEVGYVEADGTGSPLGDAAEVTALADAYAALAAGPAARASCGIGSVKGNVGHLGPASGIVGFIKAVLALRREQLPPTVNVSVPGSATGFATGPFDPVREFRGWPREPGRPRRAAVSSLGPGGNVHVVLGEPPQALAASVSAEPKLLVWSGRDEITRDAAAARLAGWLVRVGDVELADIAATLQHGRTAHQVRGAVVVRSALDAARALSDPLRVVTRGAPVRLPEPAADDTAGFAQLGQRFPAFAAEMGDVLAELGGVLAGSGDAAADVRAVAARVALARAWIAAGADPAAIADPAGLPGVLGCLGSWAGLTAVAARLAEAPAGSPDDDLWSAHLAAVAQFWVRGASLDWEKLGLPPPERRAALPGYPYARSRYGTDPPGPWDDAAPQRWSPGWRDASAEARPPAPSADGPVLVLGPSAADAARALMTALRAGGSDAVCLEPAADFAAVGNDFAGRPDDPEHLAQAVAALAGRGHSPVRIVHALGLAELGSPEARRLALDSVRAIARLDRASTGWPPVLLVRGSADVSGAEPLGAGPAELALRALAELPDCHWIDLGPQVPPQALRGAVLSSQSSDGTGHLVTALRGRRRWVPAQLPLRAHGRAAEGRGLAGRACLVLDREGDFARRFIQAVAPVGAGVVVATAADSTALLDGADTGAEVTVLDWSGHPDELPETLRSLSCLPICALVAVAVGDESVRAAVAAAADAPSLRSLDAAVAVRVTGPLGVTADSALAWGATAGLDILGAERSLTVTGSAETLGATVLDVLASGRVDDVVSVT